MRINLKKIFLPILLLVLFFGLKQASASNETTVYFFWGNGCPHCEEQKPFMEEMKNKYPGLEVKMYEAWENPQNANLFKEIANNYEIEARSVPTTFIGDFEPIVGFVEYMKFDIEEKIKFCLKEGCVDPINKGDNKSEEKKKVDKNFDSDEVCVHYFVKDDCNQCLSINELITKLSKEDDVNINSHNASEEGDNLLYQTLKNSYGLTSSGFPIAFLGDKYLIGEKAILDHLEDEIDLCQKNKNCPCPLDTIKGVTPFLPNKEDVSPENNNSLNLPFFGQMDLSSMPLYFITAIIAFVDGFNPCSLWLITFLLGIVVYSGSKKKVFLVGSVFLLVTGGFYAFFMAGLLNVFYYIGYLKWIQMTVAVIALVFAIVNIKDYFWYKKGVSFTISDKHKPGIFKKIRMVMKESKSSWAVISGTAVLAAGVVLIELPCTAGFPMIWTNILAQNSIQGFNFYLLLLLYMAIYLLDEIIVIGGILLTMKISRFEEKHGRILKLIGGMIMLMLALVMIFNPELMNNIVSSIAILGLAFLISILILFVHRKILPKFGIKIGSEKDLAEEDDNNN
jgi:thiol-disulfide isomerase/thioredoxin